MVQNEQNKNLILALGLYKGTGGPSKSIRAMQQALNAGVLSWVDPLIYASESLIWEGSVVVEGSSKPILRQLLFPVKGQTELAEQYIREAALVSCHSAWRWHMLWMHRMAQKYRIPYWFVPHGGLDPYVFETQSLIKKLFLLLGARKFIEEASCVIFTARAERDKALQICKPRRSEIIYWPLSDSDFQVERSVSGRSVLRAKLGIPEKARCLLYLGRLDPMKRPLETIEALAKSGTSVHLIMVGNEYGISLNDCQNRAKALGIEERVHVIGPVYGSEKVAYFSTADAYVSLSYRENFNFSAAESMAAGLPLLLSKGNDLGGELVGSNCAWTVRDSSIEACADAIAEVDMCSSDDLTARGESGRLWASNNLRFDQFRSKICALADELYSHRRG